MAYKKSKKNNMKKKKITKSPLSVSVITPTNKHKYIDNIFNNYCRQTYKDKELIIVLNNNKFNIEEWLEKAKKFENIRIFQIEGKSSLADCLNFAVRQSKNDVIAKFDDDDYYAPNYLEDAMSIIKKGNVKVVGKSKYYVYFENKKLLTITKGGTEYAHVGHIAGPTLVIKKEVFKKVKFKKMSYGTDQKFLRDCAKNKIKIYSINRHNFVYIRHPSKKEHTWKIKDKDYIKKCKIIKKTDEYHTYIAK